MKAAGHVGLLALTDVPAAPFDELRRVFDDLHAGGGAACYPPGLGLKDAHASKPDATADMKRILDLNPKRLREAEALYAASDEQPGAAAGTTSGGGTDGGTDGSTDGSTDGGTHADARAAFGAVLRFWRASAEGIAPKLREATALAAGSAAILQDDHYDFRSVCLSLT
jgi:hypothetical protein